MPRRDQNRPIWGQVLGATITCACGRTAEVDERTDRTTFDPTTGRFTCPACLETVTLMLTVTPLTDDDRDD